MNWISVVKGGGYGRASGGSRGGSGGLQRGFVEWGGGRKESERATGPLSLIRQI